MDSFGIHMPLKARLATISLHTVFKKPKIVFSALPLISRALRNRKFLQRSIKKRCTDSREQAFAFFYDSMLNHRFQQIVTMTISRLNLTRKLNSLNLNYYIDYHKAKVRSRRDMIEQTTRAEAASGPDGDGTYGRSEDHDVHAEPPLASGGRRKAELCLFSVDYLLDDVVCRPDEPTDFPDLFLLNATSHERSEDHGPNRRNLRNRAVRLASMEMEFFDIVLAGNQFWPLKWASCRLMMHWLKGVFPFAQAVVGTRMTSGINGFEEREKTGLEWLNKAAQDFPPALCELSELHRHGTKSVVRKSQEKANERLLKSANLGFALANSLLASYYLRGRNGFGFEKNLDEAYFRWHK
ncbi:hypothetical protein THAOC_00854 [Thalassiosira oceanica]|uniref:Uncharacterized protein n=1 Tax=Thalassiosira oceanica TaxID=159749 RepID=K0TNN9_THAOC|nr:hypothetical protein THAOC_00854 [Thalassiosira oceanica]|eukprot:EJK77321.1 hypothetical protein THAOC_00854 [Thalassiosira oceanica]